RLFSALGVRGLIDIGTERERDSPISHRHAGIEIRRLLERFGRLVMNESVNQGKSLVEESLRQGGIILGSNRMMQIPKTVKQRLMRRVNRRLQPTRIHPSRHIRRRSR